LSNRISRELLGRADIENVAGQFLNFGPPARGALGQFRPNSRDDLPVDTDPRFFPSASAPAPATLEPLINSCNPSDSSPCLAHASR